MALLPKMKDEDCVIEVVMCPSHLYALLINSGSFSYVFPSPKEFNTIWHPCKIAQLRTQTEGRVLCTFIDKVNTNPSISCPQKLMIDFSYLFWLV